MVLYNTNNSQNYGYHVSSSAYGKFFADVIIYR